MYIFIGWILFGIAILNLIILSFAFRDFGFLLTLQFLLTALGLPIGTYIITTYYTPQPSVMLVTEDKETGKKTAWYQYLEEDREPDNQARGFFHSCNWDKS